MVTEWRRSMTVPPPPLEKDHETHPTKNPIYKFVDPKLLPSS
jgi:bisphosphoglycerate-dependent phosphoglycerate mutase